MAGFVHHWDLQKKQITDEEAETKGSADEKSFKSRNTKFSICQKHQSRSVSLVLQVEIIEF